MTYIFKKILKIRAEINAKDKEMQIPSLDGEGPLEWEMATHSNILVWKIPWIEELGGLQSMKLQRVGHN